ncbi:3-oxoacyl-[acyl-carrier-protein] reductase, putative [Talaromyces stipitatus ATCC 10500]|uniref:3-oxoacyl-[acyl-carrier-protein] reductase, putative n=1 Tax=Talaromyces stipitatus (strain ATCC 10500 / CBS 375.48 / QM 6759 / NRRL 1006) TaxID=441959 RepID=B8MHY2_TALSN|nr:3-oxoacyl-[acyl-carrier-protein] reductase, putative [Talaromyces stipitatus ATCC 10500]EED16462.1 3-oxoacyl-[acyl-carrier-protein] reductase, putative [Talaromyces stipitatus ATCC 10500]
MAPLVWFVTGATSGIGAALVAEILLRGDKVIATGRKVEERLGPQIPKSDHVVFFEFDVAVEKSEIVHKVNEACAIFGHIDVVVNNAGVSLLKSVEEAEDADVMKMFQVNLFGAMRVTQAFLPHFRAQGSGTLAFTSSSSARYTVPFMSHYCASKAALSTYVEAIQTEVRALGIRCVSFECGGFLTMLGQPRAPDADKPSFGSTQPGVEAYLPLFAEFTGIFNVDPGDMVPNDMEKLTTRMVDYVKGEGLAKGRPWAVRIVMGSDAFAGAQQKLQEDQILLSRWEDMSQMHREGSRYNELVGPKMLKFNSILY